MIVNENSIRSLCINVTIYIFLDAYVEYASLYLRFYCVSSMFRSNKITIRYARVTVNRVIADP